MPVIVTANNYIVIAEQPALTVVATGTTSTVVATPSSKVMLAAGRQGPEGKPGAAGSGAIRLVFAWSDATPVQIVNVPAGKTVLKVDVVLQTPFNAASALSVGDSDDHARLFGVDDIDLSTAGTYQSHPGYFYAGMTAINVYLSPGNGASSGSGLILIYIQ